MASITDYSHSTISQVEISDATFDITDANTRSTVTALCDEVNSLTTKTANLKSTGNTADNTGVSITFDNNKMPNNSYILSLKPNTFIYWYRHPDPENPEDKNSLIWTSVFDFQKLNIEGSTLTGETNTSNYVIQITNPAVYKIGHLVIGSFILQDKYSDKRLNDAPYTLVKGLPKPSTGIKFNAIDFTTGANLKNVGFVLSSDPNTANNRGLLKWSINKSERTVNQIMVNIMYNTPS